MGTISGLQPDELAREVVANQRELRAAAAKLDQAVREAHAGLAVRTW